MILRRIVYPSRSAKLLLSLTALLGGCVSPPERIDQTAEQRAVNDPASLLRIGDAAASSGDMATATSFYRRATELQPDNADAALAYARGLTSDGHTTEAMTALRTALARTNDDSAVRIAAALGKLLVLAHRPSEAVAAFRQALTIRPATPGLLVGLGVALDASRDFQAAQTAYRQAIALEPESIAARNNLALSTALQGDTMQALASLRSLRNHVAESGGQASDLATIDGNLALVYAMRGNMRQAGEAAAGAARNTRELAENMKFYSELAQYAPASGALDSSGLAGAAPAD